MIFVMNTTVRTLRTLRLFTEDRKIILLSAFVTFATLNAAATESAADSLRGKDGGTFDEFVVTGVRDETALRHWRPCTVRTADHGSIGAY